MGVQKDHILSGMMSMVRVGANIGVTVIADGAQISGNLITASQYLDNCAAVIRGEGDSSIANAVSEYFSGLKREACALDNEGGDTFTAMEEGFLHLSNVTMIIAGEISNFKDISIRIPYSKVTGWFPGVISR
ncbi:hypothetical protein [Aeromonas veronii]|uniref:hypothetical protein n=1 Tax=Aeromonas veronii TaxID=654 RepID=UPI001F17F872|nr:hypothetical protein [Aeromonas veronii]MCF5912065.1 hypothetical protein [Aeromonas veronii]